MDKHFRFPFGASVGFRLLLVFLWAAATLPPYAVGRSASAHVLQPGAGSLSPLAAFAALGWTPDAFAAANASQETFDALAPRMEELASAVGEIVTVRKRIAEKAAAQTPGQTSIGSGGSESPDVQADRAELASKIGIARAIVVECAGPEVGQELSLWVASAEYDVDARYRTLSLSPDEWKALETAVANRRAAARSQVALSARDAQLLDQYDAQTSVIAAKTRIEQKAASIRQMMRSLRGGQ